MGSQSQDILHAPKEQNAALIGLLIMLCYRSILSPQLCNFFGDVPGKRRDLFQAPWKWLHSAKL